MADWFTSMHFDPSDGPGFTAAHALVRAVNSDPAWRAWWSPSAFKRLEIIPVPVEWPVDRPILQSHKKRFMLGQPCPELAVFIKSRPAPRVTPGWTVVYERVGHAVCDALSMGLDNVGKILDLGPRTGREEWNDRADELTETTTLRSVLGPDPEGGPKAGIGRTMPLSSPPDSASCASPDRSTQRAVGG